MNTKKILWISISCIIIFAAGAFFAGRLFNDQGNSLAGLLFFGENNQSDMEYDIEIIPAAEMPQTPKISSGIFLGRVDNILTINEIQTSALGGNSQTITSENGDFSYQVEGDVQKREILVTAQTKVYCDETDMSDAIQNRKDSVQQVLVAGDVDELDTMNFLRVWGRKNGDRIIADIIVYYNPIILP